MLQPSLQFSLFIYIFWAIRFSLSDHPPFMSTYQTQ